jgi:AraC-like DNA-binding protein
MNTSFTISAGWVKRFYLGLIDYGISESALHLISELKQSDFEDEDQRIPFEQYLHLGQMAPKLTGKPEIGLILGCQARFQDIGIVYQLASNCNTVKESLAETVRYSELGNEVSEALFKEDKDSAEWSEYYPNSGFICIPLLEFECCQKVEILKQVIGKHFKPSNIKFQYPAPGYLNKYNEIFQVPLSFEQERSGIVFKKEYINLANISPQPYVKNILSRHANKLKSDLAKSKQLQDKVKKIIISQLDAGYVTLDSIAEELNLSRRTVYRKLKAENSSYKDLLIDSKKNLAREYLKNSSLSVYEIAVRLGFSEASSFHRAFKSWFGISPGRYRWID